MNLKEGPRRYMFYVSGLTSGDKSLFLLITFIRIEIFQNFQSNLKGQRRLHDAHCDIILCMCENEK